MTWDLETCSLPEGTLRDEILVLAGNHEVEWATHLNADPSLPPWVLARSQGRLVAYLSIFDPSGHTAEVSAFVDPAFRRRGVFSSLLAEARRRWDHPDRSWVLVVDRDSEEGSAVARHWGRWSFSEATLGLGADRRPPVAGLPPGLTLEVAGPGDREAAGRVHERAGGDPPGAYAEFLAQVLADPTRTLLLLKEEGRVIGTGGFHRDGTRTSIFGLAVDPDRQGRGWGRVLVTGLLDFGAPGTQEFTLEVDSTNGRAEALYRSVGFTDRRVTDYYQITPAQEVSL